MIKIHGLSGELETIKYTGNLGALINQYNPQWRDKKEWEGELYVNGNLVLPTDFDSVAISELCQVDIYMRPHGGIFKAVGNLLGGVLNFAFGFLMPSSKRGNQSRESLQRGDKLELVDIKANQAKLGAFVPEIFGRNRRFMDYLTEPRRRFSNPSLNVTEQEVDVLLCIGVGTFDVQDLKIGATAIGEVKGSKYMLFNPNANLGTYSDIWHTSKEVGVTANGSAGLEIPSDTSFTNTYRATPVGVKASVVEIDLFFPQGLVWIQEGWSPAGWEVPVVIDIFDARTGDLIISREHNMYAYTPDQMGFTVSYALPYEFEPSVRIRRKNSEATEMEIYDNVNWFGLKAKIGSKSNYPNWHTMYLRLKSGGKLAASAENQVNAIVTRHLPVLRPNGSWSSPQPTRDIASAFKYITNSIKYTDSEIDMHELLHLHNTKWKPRGENIDYMFDGTTVKQAIDITLNAGLSDMTIANGKIKPVRDDIRTTIEQSYSAQNTISQISKTFRAKKINDFDGVEVEYIDAERGYEKKVIVCKLPQSNGFKLRKVSIKGVTDRKRAWQIGMRLASEDRYVNKDYSIKTEMDALNSEYGSFIGIIEEIPELSQSCLILQVNDDHVVVSEPPLGNASIFSWRDECGKLQGPFNIERVEDNRIYVQLNKKPLVTPNQELPHAYIGTSQKMTRTALVDDISPNGTNNATIRASNYDERVYAYDNSEIIE